MCQRMAGLDNGWRSEISLSHSLARLGGADVPLWQNAPMRTRFHLSPAAFLALHVITVSSRTPTTQHRTPPGRKRAYRLPVQELLNEL